MADHAHSNSPTQQTKAQPIAEKFTTYDIGSLWALPKMPNHAHYLTLACKTEIPWPVCTFNRPLSLCKKSGWYRTNFRRNSRLKNPAIWLVKKILTNNARTKILPNMGFSQDNQEFYVVSCFPVFEKNLQNQKKKSFWTVFDQICTEKSCKYFSKIRLYHFLDMTMIQKWSKN